tara:strand:+ start:2000 stop:2248 length:249 start_codon:yes stop_codon:yes gene_type:complete
MAGKKRNFFGIPKGQLAMMLAITDREDIDSIEKVSQVLEIRSLLTNDQLSDFFGFGYQWIAVRIKKKRDQDYEKRNSLKKKK